MLNIFQLFCGLYGMWSLQETFVHCTLQLHYLLYPFKNFLTCIIFIYKSIFLALWLRGNLFIYPIYILLIAWLKWIWFQVWKIIFKFGKQELLLIPRLNEERGWAWAYKIVPLLFTNDVCSLILIGKMYF